MKYYGKIVIEVECEAPSAGDAMIATEEAGAFMRDMFSRMKVHDRGIVAKRKTEDGKLTPVKVTITV